MTAIAVTIAGSDSGGGAGIQADLKTFSALGVYGASVVTALTAQNTLGVKAVHDVPADFVRAEMEAVYSDLKVGATKIGMLSQAGVIRAVAAGLDAYATGPVVLDPVMVAASGDPLIADEAVDVLSADLFPRAALITPNLFEAARLLGEEVAESREAMEGQAAWLLETGAGAVLLKGGHGDGPEAADLLMTRQGARWFAAPRRKSDRMVLSSSMLRWTGTAAACWMSRRLSSAARSCTASSEMREERNEIHGEAREECQGRDRVHDRQWQRLRGPGTTQPGATAREGRAHLPDRADHRGARSHADPGGRDPRGPLDTSRWPRHPTSCCQPRR